MTKNKLTAFAVIFALLTVLLLLTACGGTEETTPAETTEADRGYTVKVQDYKGNPITVDVMVEIFKGEEFVTMKRVDKDGNVSFDLEEGDYTFVPSSAEAEFYFDEELCTLSATAKSATVILYQKAKDTQTIYPPTDDSNLGYKAALVGEGATWVAIDKPEMSYYVFTPTRGGIYKFSYISETAMTIGYFGNPNIVLSENIAEVKDGTFTVEIADSSIGNEGGGTVQLVIGIRSLAVKETVLVIERVGDAEKPLLWENLPAKEVPTEVKENGYLNHELVDLDVTDKDLKVVLNETDGFYHLGDKDGPVVYVRINSASPYLASFKTICDNTRMCYIYLDEDGKPVKKESYNDIIQAYSEVANNLGICPLTTEMITVIKNTGAYLKWWDFSAGGNNIFTSNAAGEDIEIDTSSITPDTAWMFACCIVKEFVRGTEASPITVNASPDGVNLVATEKDIPVYIRSSVKAILKIENAEGVTVMYNGVTYTALDGVIEVMMDADVISFTVTKDSDGVVSFTYTEPVEEDAE